MVQPGFDALDPRLHAGAPAGGLRVQALGSFAIWRGGEAIPPAAWSRRKAAALFACLLSAPGYRLHRDQLIEALWPDVPAAAGANNLRVTLHRLRAILDRPGAAGSFVRADGEAIALVPHPSGRAVAAEADWFDAAAFANAAVAALAGRNLDACRAARARYTGPYLPDALYDEWALRRRGELEQQHQAVLAHGARLAREQGDDRESVDWLVALLATDPCHEGAARGLMRIHARGGRRDEALRVYAGLARALRADLGQEPDPRTRALAAAVRAAPAAQARQAAEEVAQAARADLPHDVPALAAATAAAAPRGNLPAPLDGLIGRAGEHNELCALLAHHRLVTLVGPGGVGKTRLALAVAERCAPRHPEGAWLVELAGLASAGAPGAPLVGEAVAAALGLQEEAGRPILATLTDHLREKHLLLVLDNCEHLAGACALLAQALLRACPGLHLLASSRERLEVAGEHAYPLAPLAVPDSRAASIDALHDVASVALFLERARERRPGFALTAETAPAVAQICRRLEGLPLALELAAARLSVLPVAAIAARLDDCCRLLSGGPRTGGERQRSLRGALDWSHGLLAAPEQALFRRLAAFAGGWALEAAEAVCAGEAVEDWAVLDLLGSLVNKSLVALEERGAEGRYRLLEPVRQYALERLAAAGEQEAVRGRHLDWCMALAEEAAPALTGPEQGRWLARLDAEYDNLRAALAGSERGCALSPAGASLAAALWRFWEMRGHLVDGRRWLEAAAVSGAPPAMQARALGGAGALAQMQGDIDHAARLFERRLALGREQGDRRGVAQALYSLGTVAIAQGDAARAVPLIEESLAQARDLGDPWGLFALTNLLGLAERLRGDHGRAQALFEESMAMAGELGDDGALAMARNNLGTVARDRGDLARARSHYEAALALHRRLGNPYHLASTLCNLGEVAADAGEAERAVALYREGLALLRAVGDRPHLAPCLEGLARCALQRGQPAACAAILGAAARLRARLGARPGPDEQAVLDRVIPGARAALGAAAYDAAIAAGEALPLEEALALAHGAAPERAAL